MSFATPEQCSFIVCSMPLEFAEWAIYVVLCCSMNIYWYQNFLCAKITISCPKSWYMSSKKSFFYDNFSRCTRGDGTIISVNTTKIRKTSCFAKNDETIYKSLTEVFHISIITDNDLRMNASVGNGGDKVILSPSFLFRAG